MGVSAGGGRSLAITASGAAWVWGGADPGPFLAPARLPWIESAPPAVVVPVEGLRGRLRPEDARDEEDEALADVSLAALALARDGALWASLPPGSAGAPFHLVRPVHPCRWTSVSAGGWGVAGIDVDGDVWFWDRREAVVVVGAPDGSTSAAAVGPPDCRRFGRLERAP